MIKQITKMIGIVFVFLITQIICTLGVFIFKLFSDSQWYDNLYVCIETGKEPNIIFHKQIRKVLQKLQIILEIAYQMF